MALPGVGVARLRHGQVSSAYRHSNRSYRHHTGSHCLPVVTWLKCASCGQYRQSPASSGAAPNEGSGFPLCYDCYERQTGGAYVSLDEYWDGRTWIPLAKGE